MDKAIKSYEGGKEEEQKVSADQGDWILVSSDQGDSNQVNPDNFKNKMSASTKQKKVVG